MEQVQQTQLVATPPSVLELTNTVDGSTPAEIVRENLARIKLFSEGADALKTCHFTRLCYDKSNPSEVRAIRLPCRNWECAVCGPRLKYDWYMNFLSAMSKEPHLEAIDMPPKEFEAFRKRLDRANDRSDGRPYQYGRMWLDADKTKIRVITNLEDKGLPIAKESLEAFLTESIGQIPWMSRPIYASLAWMPKNQEAEVEEAEDPPGRARKQKKKEPLGDIGYTSLSPQEIAVIAEQSGISHYCSGYDGFSVTLTLPPELMEPMAFATFLIHVGVRLKADAPDLDLAGIERRLREL